MRALQDAIHTPPHNETDFSLASPSHVALSWSREAEPMIALKPANRGDRLPPWVIALLVVFLALRVADLLPARHSSRLSQQVSSQVDEKTMSAMLSTNMAAKQAYIASFGRPGDGAPDRKGLQEALGLGGESTNGRSERARHGPASPHPTRPARASPVRAGRKQAGPERLLRACRPGRAAPRRPPPLRGRRAAVGRSGARPPSLARPDRCRGGDACAPCQTSAGGAPPPSLSCIAPRGIPPRRRTMTRGPGRRR